MPTKVAPLAKKSQQTDARFIASEPYYEPCGNEVALFEADVAVAGLGRKA